MERSLIIMKPDSVQRNLVGEMITRFERKGLKIIGLKMMTVSDAHLDAHYGHHKEKPFFPTIKKYIQACPVVVMALEGHNAVSAIRLIVGPTKGYEADAGSIRGDFSLSTQSNLVHASDSVAAGISEIARFFEESELFDYSKIDTDFIYADLK